ncbi:enoyl-CoA hydratase/isomerase family protein [Nocardia carnea]|uniref:enoyl-CoA hydratase/isomerase family protein n=1 Tax=Nocardia carnea TaxID=37328 RepID=UPI002454F926|nr:enoyl-CoA hydratase/isomerase family protein [Nocardia carnea]
MTGTQPQRDAAARAEATSSTMAGRFAHLRYETENRVATITLNRPERLNALSHGPTGVHAELVAALAVADKDPEVRCVVLTGAGRAFSSGGDLQADPPHEGPLAWFRFMEEEDHDFAALRDCRKPVIAAVNGLCYGAGLILAAHADIRIASSAARFGFIESRMGGTGIEVFPFLIGIEWSKFLMFTGELISAEKAKEIGLVLEVVDEDRFAERIRDLAQRIAAMPWQGVQLNKRVIDTAADMMGLHNQKVAARGINALVGSSSKDAEAADGRRLTDVLAQEGFKGFLRARDAAFRTPWLEEKK